jgi:hypothetical protein
MSGGIIVVEPSAPVPAPASEEAQGWLAADLALHRIDADEALELLPRTGHERSTFAFGGAANKIDDRLEMFGESRGSIGESGNSPGESLEEFFET